MNYNWTIIWNYRKYHAGQVSLDFIVWLVKNEKFTLRLEGEEFTVELRRENYWYLASADDSECGTNLGYSVRGHDNALYYLIEQLSESITV